MNLNQNEFIVADLSFFFGNYKFLKIISIIKISENCIYTTVSPFMYQ